MMRGGPQYEVAYQDLVDLVSRHAAEVDSAELLAIAANMVGKLVAMQDPSKMSVMEALRLVETNIELGNEQACRRLARGRLEQMN